MKKIIFILILFFPLISNAKNCRKGIPCGNTCISANKTCHIGTYSDYNNRKLTQSKTTQVNSTQKKQNFNDAKNKLIKIYKDNPITKTFYCGCDFSFLGKKGIVDLASCGYEVRKNENRASRIEWEHVMPAENFGRHLKCWIEGGRKGCQKDTTFNKMEGDMHNLQPAIGEVNGDRSNYRYSQFTKKFSQYGQCKVATDFKSRKFQPREDSYGTIARTYLYMSYKYGINLSKQDRQLMVAWDKKNPPTFWECERNKIIKNLQGNDNPFISNKCLF